MKRLIVMLCLIFQTFGNDKADLFIFSYDRPLQCEALLHSIEAHVSNYGQIVIIYRVSSPDFDKAYEQCFIEHKQLPLVLKKQGTRGVGPAKDFKYFVLNAIKDSPNDYIVFVVDDIIIKDTIDLSDCVYYLKQTGAYGFYLRLGENITQCYTMLASNVPTHELIDGKVMKWKFSDATYDWNYPNTVDLTVYKKLDVFATVANLAFTSPNTFEGAWDHVGQYNDDRQKFGLCYRQSKMINIPYNCVQEDRLNPNMGHSKHDFLDLFIKGRRMDIEQYAHVQNKAPHIDLPLYLVEMKRKNEL